MAFVRSYEDEHILVVANLSRFVQHVELDLSKFKGLSPVEFFGRSAFPDGDRSPLRALAGLARLLLVRARKADRHGATRRSRRADAISDQRRLGVAGCRRERPAARKDPPGVSRFVPMAGGKARVPKAGPHRRDLALAEDMNPCIAIVEVEYTEGEPERYVLPLAFLRDAAAARASRAGARAGARRTHTAQDHGRRARHHLRCDRQRRLRPALARCDRAATAHQGDGGRAVCLAYPRVPKMRGPGESPCRASPLRAEGQGNSSMTYEDRLVFKLFRRVEEGVNPDLEVGRCFLEKGIQSRRPSSPAGSNTSSTAKSR